MYVVKNTKVTTEYRDTVPTRTFNFSSFVILDIRQCVRPAEKQMTTYPAMAADDKFVRSIRLMQYNTPTVNTRRRSMRPISFFVSSGEKSDSNSPSVEAFVGVYAASDCIATSGFSMSWVMIAKGCF